LQCFCKHYYLRELYYSFPESNFTHLQRAIVALRKLTHEAYVFVHGQLFSASGIAARKIAIRQVLLNIYFIILF